MPKVVNPAGSFAAFLNSIEKSQPSSPDDELAEKPTLPSETESVKNSDPDKKPNLGNAPPDIPSIVEIMKLPNTDEKVVAPKDPMPVLAQLPNPFGKIVINKPTGPPGNKPETNSNNDVAPSKDKLA